MFNVSLTSSMRQNLLSSQQTAKLQDVTSARLATGLKVSSAIENPSSYYTSSSLQNRANDLSALLDSMGQGIQTIKAATETLETGLQFLEQARALTNVALENAKPRGEINNDWLVANGVKAENIVTSKAELLTRVANTSAGDTIVVFGDINMGDDKIALKDGVSLVGAQKIIDDKGVSHHYKAEPVTITFSKSTENIGVAVGNNAIISDLNINFSIENRTSMGGAIFANQKTGVIVKNVNISSYAGNSSNQSGAIHTNASQMTLSGKINIKTSGATSTSGIASENYAGVGGFTVTADAKINIHTDNLWGAGVQNGRWNIQGEINIKTEQDFSRAVLNLKDSVISGTISIDNNPIKNSSYFYLTTAVFTGTAKVFINGEGMTQSALTFETGSQIAFSNKGTLLTTLNNNTVTVLTPASMMASGNYSQSVYIPVEEVQDEENENIYMLNSMYIPEEYFNQYSLLLSQYNDLLNDGDYKGINLLKGDQLQVKFNVDGSSKVEVKGILASSDSLGISDKTWDSAWDVQKSGDELYKATLSLRQYTEEFGNSYSIIDNRLKFNENLINILTEGADKLTLADMNEESANMLALQTRQQLAVNALSLSSQASQGVLKLF